MLTGRTSSSIKENFLCLKKTKTTLIDNIFLGNFPDDYDLKWIKTDYEYVSDGLDNYKLHWTLDT